MLRKFFSLVVQWLNDNLYKTPNCDFSCGRPLFNLSCTLGDHKNVFNLPHSAIGNSKNVNRLGWPMAGWGSLEIEQMHTQNT